MYKLSQYYLLVPWIRPKVFYEKQKMDYIDMFITKQNTHKTINSL